MSDMGKSMPMMETVPNYSMVAVYKKKGELKFVHLKSEKFLGRFTVLIFMDNKLTEMEIDEWKDFSNHVEEFKQAGAYVVGVCTDSHISMRAMMMNSLADITFPIISDRDGDLSRSFGVLKVKSDNFGAVRALVILDKEGRMVHLALHNEHTRSYPGKVMELINHLKSTVNTAIDESAAESLKSLSMSTVIIDEQSWEEMGNKDVAKKEEIKSDETEGPKEIKKTENKDVAKKEDQVEKTGDEKKDNVAKNDSPKERKEKKKIVSKKSKENENKTTKSKNTKVRNENKMANRQKHSSDGKAPAGAQSKGHKKPSSHNWIEAGAPLSQD